MKNTSEEDEKRDIPDLKDFEHFSHVCFWEGSTIMSCKEKLGSIE
jgi:hypothetical protein